MTVSWLALLRGLTTHRGRCPLCGSQRFRLSRGRYTGPVPELLGLVVCRCLACQRHFPTLGNPPQAAPTESDEDTEPDPR